MIGITSAGTRPGLVCTLHFSVAGRICFAACDNMPPRSPSSLLHPVYSRCRLCRFCDSPLCLEPPIRPPPVKPGALCASRTTPRCQAEEVGPLWVDVGGNPGRFHFRSKLLNLEMVFGFLVEACGYHDPNASD